jgi:hypothetical protein
MKRDLRLLKYSQNIEKTTKFTQILQISPIYVITKLSKCKRKDFKNEVLTNK